MSPLVTIAIPAYKAAFLYETIASALAQTYTSLEIIIVNDHSPEDLESVVKAFDDPRIHYFVNRENVGATDPSANWNECLGHATGEFFCLLCDDDLYEPTFVEELLQLRQRHPQCHVFRSGVRLTDAAGTETDFFPSSPEWESVEEYMWHVYRGFRRQTISEFLFWRSAMEQAGGYVRLPYAWGSDYLSIYRFALQGGIASTAKRLTTFRDSGRNLSSDQKHMDEKLLAFKQYIGLTKKLIAEQGFNETLLLPAIENHYRKAIIAHMNEADRKALSRMFTHRRDFDITTTDILKLLIKKNIKLLKR